MPDRYHEFDQMFRDRLSNQTATPPDSVWSNIQAERSFGHIVANKISSSWRIIGTLLLLAIAGGTSALLLSNEENTHLKNEASLLLEDQNKLANNSSLAIQKELSHSEVIHSLSYQNEPSTASIDHSNLRSNEIKSLSDQGLLASNTSMGFGMPNFGDNTLGLFINEMDGWGTATPASKVRFFHLNDLDKKDGFEIIMVKTPLIPEDKWEYVIETDQKKSFRDRTSFNFYLGPQFINKVLTPKYNMETSFLEERQETENTRLAYSAGMSIQYELKNHKFIESGVQLTQIYEEVRINGDMRFSNQYDFVEIPLLIGYQDRESKWGWFIKGGLGIQIFNNYKGYILKRVEDRIAAPTPEQNVGAEYRISGNNVVQNLVKNEHSLSSKQDRNEVYDLSSDENPYRSGGIFNIHFAAGVTYYHSIRTSFSLTPYYRQNLNSLTKTSADFNERVSTMGLMIGTNVKF